MTAVRPADTTVVHLLRHGEVHNPTGVLYGRLPGFHLSERGLQMAQMVGDHLASRDVACVVASSLERAQETAAPIAAPHGLSDHHRRPRHRGGQLLRGQDVRRRRRVAAPPAALAAAGQPVPPRRGESRTRRSRRGCWRRSPTPATPPAATRP